MTVLAQKTNFDLPPNAVLLDDGTVQLPLSRPVTVEGYDGKLERLVFREPTAGDLIDAGLAGVPGAQQNLTILASVTGNDTPVGLKLLRGLTARDYLVAQRVLTYFFSSGQTDGQ